MVTTGAPEPARERVCDLGYLRIAYQRAKEADPDVHVLSAPLAITLVNHQAPQGDQFLFVRSDGNRVLVVVECRLIYWCQKGTY